VIQGAGSELAVEQHCIVHRLDDLCTSAKGTINDTRLYRCWIVSALTTKIENSL